MVSRKLIMTALVLLLSTPLVVPTRADPRTDPEALPVGRVITPRGPVCTGVLIGTHAVLTAAHCLTTRAGDGYFSAGLIQFAAHRANGTQAYAKSARVHVNPAYRLPVSVDPDNLAQDWAVLILSEGLGTQIKPATLISEGDLGDPADYQLEVVAFGRARTLHPTITVNRCRLLDRTASLLNHSCLVEPGSSGSVLLGRRDGELYALAVNVAVRGGPTPLTRAALLPALLHALARESAPEETPFRSPFAPESRPPWPGR